MPKIIAITAPSGAGKSTIANRVLQQIPELRFSVSVTTRPKRHYETDGVHYHFVTEEQFQELIDEGSLIEYEEVYPGRFYGTLRSEVENSAGDRPVLLDIDVKGALKVKQLYGDDALTIFIKPPSLDVLKNRLYIRATETEETLAIRMRRAREEITYADRFDAVVLNDDLDKAVAETACLIRTFLTR